MSVGGANAQRGFQFQDYVALHYALDLLKNGDLMSAEIESTGLEADPNRLFVDDIILRYRTGAKRFVQVKMSARGMKAWSMKSLAQNGELEKIVKQLSICATDFVELVCPHGFSDLEELRRDVYEFHDPIALKVNGGQAAKDRLDQFCSLSGIDEFEVFSYVRRLDFGSRHQEKEWKEHILTKLYRYVEEPDQALNVLLALIRDHQCKLVGAPGVLTADVLKRKLVEASIPAIKSEQESLVEEVREWKGDRVVRGSSFPMRLVPIGKNEPEQIQWSRHGPQFFLALRPKKPIDTLPIDVLEEKFGLERKALPTFVSCVDKKIARVKDGLCSYALWTKPAAEPTFCQKVLSQFSSRFEPLSKPRILTFSYLGNSGEIWLSYAFRLKSGYGGTSKEKNPLPANIEKIFAMALDDARGTLSILGANGPYEGIAHISGGIAYSYLPLLDQDAKLTGEVTSTTDEIEVEKDFIVASSEISSGQALKPFFGALWESLHSKRPAHYDDLHVLSCSNFQG